MSIKINIDHGHCETTATTVRVKGDKNCVERLLLSGNHENVIHSAISLTYDQIEKLGAAQINENVMKSLGKIRIGGDAVTQPKDGEFFVYFKVSPEHFDRPCGKSAEAKEAKLTYGKVMAAFLYQVVQNVLEFNKGIKEIAGAGKNDINLLIGCPATKKWMDAGYMLKYAQLVRQATGIQNVGIVPESRAALFSAIDSGSRIINSSKGVMVYDFGSSTADSTYMLLGRQINEYSWDLGASLIEQEFLRMALQNAKAKDPTASAGANRDTILRSLRMAKEEYFRSGAETDVTCRFGTAGGKVAREPITVDEETMEQVTNEALISVQADSAAGKPGTWQGLCREFMQNGKDYLDAHKLPCETVVLTGGASHMGFIEELCKQVYGENIQIVRDKNPSYCVATGLSWVATADERRDECIKEAKKLLRANKTCSYEVLNDAIKKEVYAYCSAVISKQTEDWANAASDMLTVRDLENRIKTALNEDKRQAEMRELVKNEVTQWLTKFKSGTSEAINSQAAKIYSEEVAAELLLSDAIWKTINSNDVKFNLDSSKVVEKLKISSLINRVIQEMVYYVVAIGVMVALVELPGINFVIGWILGLIAKGMVSDEDKDKARNRGARRRIANQMPRILRNKDIVASFNENISKSMNDIQKEYDALVDRIVETAIDMVMLRRFDEAE